VKAGFIARFPPGDYSWANNARSSGRLMRSHKGLIRRVIEKTSSPDEELAVRRSSIDFSARSMIESCGWCPYAWPSVDIDVS